MTTSGLDIGLAIILAVAGMTKVHQPKQRLRDRSLRTRTAARLIGLAEIVISGLVLVGPASIWSRSTLCATYLLFLLVHLLPAARRRPSCGCMRTALVRALPEIVSARSWACFGLGLIALLAPSQRGGLWPQALVAIATVVVGGWLSLAGEYPDFVAVAAPIGWRRVAARWLRQDPLVRSLIGQHPILSQELTRRRRRVELTLSVAGPERQPYVIQTSLTRRNGMPQIRTVRYDEMETSNVELLATG